MRHQLRLRFKVLYCCLVGDEASVEAEVQGIVLLFGRR